PTTTFSTLNALLSNSAGVPSWFVTSRTIGLPAGAIGSVGENLWSFSVMLTLAGSSAKAAGAKHSASARPPARIETLETMVIAVSMALSADGLARSRPGPRILPGARARATTVLCGHGGRQGQGLRPCSLDN